MVSLRKKFLAVVMCVTCGTALALFCLATSFDTARAMTVSGRAYVVYINMPSAGITDQYLVDTGWLSPVGGAVDESAASLDIPNVLNTGEVESRSHGDDCRGDSHFLIEDGVLLPGDAGEISFGRAHGDDDDECCDERDDPHAAVIEDLTFGGIPITVTGAYDQVVIIAGVGTLTINEHGRGHHGGGGGGGDDCDDDEDHWVNALHLVLESGGEVIVGSAYFHSHDHCCAVPTSPSTWGGIKALYMTK